MPTADIRRQLTPDSFHQELVKAMGSSGFARMYQFRATTERDIYHVPATYAQETTHFFYLPDQGFLVQLALAECIDESGYCSWWTGAVYLQLDTQAMVEYEVYYICSQHEGPRFFMDECETLGHVLGNLDGLLAPFHSRGGSRALDYDDDYDSYGWKLESNGHLTVTQLVTFVDGLRTHFGPFLQPTLSHNFSVFGFTNDYAWPEIRERFWRSFPTRLLKKLVPGRIRGRESVRTRMR